MIKSFKRCLIQEKLEPEADNNDNSQNVKLNYKWGSVPLTFETGDQPTDRTNEKMHNNNDNIVIQTLMLRTLK